MSTPPTVVLVHGAFADASSFGKLIRELQADDIKVLAPAVPNRSLLGDADYIASVLASIDGPVVLVGHSYGGAVITVAGAADNVKALVYLSGYALQEGESLGEMQGRFPDSDLARALVYTPFPGGTDVSVDIERFPAVLAHDIDPETGRVLAVSQRPLAGAAFEEKAPVAAWKTKPAWGLVSSSDRAINPDVERFGYKRAGARTVEVDSSHLVMLSHPERAADVIREAIIAVGR
ncbi:alpha/beta hydrolase [Actinoplanes sp. NPDC048796]|uniref:alpha/beta fold hydrolase n=1 Tax=unclassified Actinoplanes TaxID=2626549 RepID=UPI0033D840A9